jgi:hypothetical protein
MGLNIPGVETLSEYGGLRVLSRVHAWRWLMSPQSSTTLADFIHAVAFRRFVFCSTGIAVVVVERLVRRWRGVRLAGSAGAVDH